MEIIGYLSFILIGLTLGLIGAGGSILTVPILVYLFKLDSNAAIRYSLFVVGTTSFVSSISKSLKKEVLFRKGLIFASISVLVVSATRHYLLPKIPDIIYTSENFTLSHSTLTMVTFAILMAMAAKPMIATSKNEVRDSKEGSSTFLLIACAAITGLLTALLGAGGGFLIVPALMLFFNLDIRVAIGTSLFIIALNAITGFISDLGGTATTDWNFLIKITSLALLGSFIGEFISVKCNKTKLKKSFGWFVLCLAITIIIVQVLNFNTHSKSAQHQYSKTFYKGFHNPTNIAPIIFATLAKKQHL